MEALGWPVASIAPLPARWLRTQITTSPSPQSYAGYLRPAIVSLFAEGSSWRKLTCRSPGAGSFCTNPHWECLGRGGQEYVADNTTGLGDIASVQNRGKAGDRNLKSVSSFPRESHGIARAGLEILLLLPQPPKHWDYRASTCFGISQDALPYQAFCMSLTPWDPLGRAMLMFIHFKLYFIHSMCMYRQCVCPGYGGNGGQTTTPKSQSFLSCGSQGWSSGHQAWQPVLLPVVPFHCHPPFFFFCPRSSKEPCAC